MPELTVNTQTPYIVTVERGVLARAGGILRGVSKCAKAAVISDRNVHMLYGAALKASLESAGIEVFEFTFPAGESAKTLETVSRIYAFLAEHEFTRTDAVAALGGGVAGDIAGFASATYLRGMDFFQVPTSLLAMVDSSVGGKTGVDITAGKNLVGSFHQPLAVAIDPDTLSTLPEQELRSGMGEIIKYAAIMSSKLGEMLESDGGIDYEAVITESLSVKKSVVELDTFDTGIRQVLNFGHTLGHAIELHSGFEVAHGMAVGMGMAMITEFSEALGYTQPGTAAQLKALLMRFGLPTSYSVPLKELFKIAKNDKKRKGAMITLALLERMGKYRLESFALSQLTGETP